MPEYIYALHDFLPENDDEVGFRAGERIEVIEKDDQFGDGWWQVRHVFVSFESITQVMRTIPGTEYSWQRWPFSCQLHHFDPTYN